MKKKHEHLLEYLMTVEEIQRAAKKYDRQQRWLRRWEAVKGWFKLF
jgi:hypothetical protein